MAEANARQHELIRKLLYDDAVYRGVFGCGFNEICTWAEDSKNTLELLSKKIAEGSRPLELHINSTVWRTMHCCLPYMGGIWHEEVEWNSAGLSKANDDINDDIIYDVNTRVVKHHKTTSMAEYLREAVVRYFKEKKAHIALAQLLTAIMIFLVEIHFSQMRLEMVAKGRQQKDVDVVNAEEDEIRRMKDAEMEADKMHGLIARNLDMLLDD